jgi:hypothetical protein
VTFGLQFHQSVLVGVKRKDTGKEYIVSLVAGKCVVQMAEVSEERRWDLGVSSDARIEIYSDGRTALMFLTVSYAPRVMKRRIQLVR